MAQQRINVGSGEYSGDGESLRSAFTKTNENFDEVYTNIADILSTATTDQLVNGPHNFVLGADAKLTLPSTGGYVNTLYTDNGGSRTKLEKKISSSTTTGVIAKLELDLDNEHIRLAIGNYAINDQWIDNTWAFSSDGTLTLPLAGRIVNNTSTWTFGENGVLTMPDGYYGDGRIAFNFEGYNWGNIRSHNRQVYIESGEGTTTTYSQIAVGQEISLSSIYDITLRTATTSTGDLYNDGTDHNPSFNNWTFGTDGTSTLPATNKTTTEFVPTAGHIVTGVENYLANLGTNIYRWEIGSTTFMSAINIPNGEGLDAGWIFYTEGNPAAFVTVTNVIGPVAGNVDVIFSSPLAAGPYVARSANYVAAHYSPVVIGFGSNNWTFSDDKNLTLPVGGKIINLEIDGGDSLG